MGEPLREGNRYRCPIKECGCEIVVVKGSENCPTLDPQPPKCCCGISMVKVDEATAS